MVILPPTTHTVSHPCTCLEALNCNTGQDGQKCVKPLWMSAGPLLLLFDPCRSKDQNDEYLPVIISSILFHHVLHHCAYVLHCGTVYWSPIGRPLIAWRLSRKKQEKSKQRNSFVNSLLLLAADLAQVVMPILLEHTQTSYCHPSLAGLRERKCVCVSVSACACVHI